MIGQSIQKFSCGSSVIQLVFFTNPAGVLQKFSWDLAEIV